MNDNRESIRNEIKHIRNLQSTNDIYKNSIIMTDKLFSNQIFQNSNSIGFYYSLKKEVSTSNMIQKSLDLGKKVSLPKIDSESKTMNFHIINGIDNLQKNHFDIYEPINGDISNNIDVIIVPGIAFDQLGNRLGFGSGYYDKFLKSQTSIYKIALAFDFQLIDNIDVQEHDVPMDLIITENRLITIK
tara:strand:+ start:5693 stop:6253 length:561 start_codon:yes stop_codon:yes gene_type:complete